MTQNGIETVNLLKRNGFNPNLFNKETAWAAQEMVKLMQEGVCDEAYVVSHIDPGKFSFMDATVKRLHKKKNNLRLLRELGIDGRDIEAVREMSPADGFEASAYLVAEKCCEINGKAFSRLSKGQRECVYDACRYFGIRMGSALCDPDIPEAAMAELINELLNARLAGVA